MEFGATDKVVKNYKSTAIGDSIVGRYRIPTVSSDFPTFDKIYETVMVFILKVRTQCNLTCKFIKMLSIYVASTLFRTTVNIYKV